MKKLVGLLFIITLIGITLLTGCGSSSTPTPAPTSTPVPTVGPGSYTIHYDGDPATGCGANTFAECLVHFNTTKLQSYVGCNLVGIEIFFYNDGTPMTLNYTAEIFNGVGETISTPGNLLYSYRRNCCERFLESGQFKQPHSHHQWDGDLGRFFNFLSKRLANLL